ncbi:MAG TPA: DMT family transporter [Oligoflexus sp.]|nr:DMT family transporter [Oligoflexus sp.]HYX32981.1 DMT family transporter [Oligoflexus sp.]
MSFSVLLLLTGMLSNKLGASVAKQIFSAAHPIGITVLRTSLAALILLAVFRPWRVQLDWRAWACVLPYGCALGTMNILFYLSLQRLPLGIVIAIEFIGPLGLALFTSRRKLDFAWVILAATGITLISPFAGAEKAVDLQGFSLALAAGGCWALYIVFGQHVSLRLPPGPATAVGMLVAAVVVSPFAFIYADARIFQIEVWWMSLAVAVLCSVLPYPLDLMALKQIPAKTFGILMSVEPAMAALVGFVFLGEELNPQQWLALGCIMSASAGCTIFGREKAADF